MRNSFLLIFAGASIAIACNQNPKNSDHHQNKDSEQVAVDTLAYKMQSFFKTTPGCKQDTCKAYVAVKYPVFGKKEWDNYVLKLITAAPFKDKPAPSLAVAADSFLNEYAAFKKEFSDSPAGYEWEQWLTVPYQDKDVVSFSHTTYAYTGGAHGMETILFYNIHPKNQQKLGLQDLLKTGYQASLTQIGESIFRKDEGLKPDETLESYFFENQKFVLNDNFLITPKGLLFLYNPYEIKAYASGKTELLIPYSALKGLIADNSILAKYK